MQDLAEAGFHYTGTEAVGCIICGVQISGWKAGDIPLKRHIKESPKCSFAKYKRKKLERKGKAMFCLTVQNLREMKILLTNTKTMEKMRRKSSVENLTDLLHSRNGHYQVP